MKDLSNIDLVAIDCARPFEALKALEYCNRFFKFNKSILFTDQVFSHSFIQSNLLQTLICINGFFSHQILIKNVNCFLLRLVKSMSQ